LIQYQRSGPRNPCPVCARVKDSDCRWNAEVVYCHQGSTIGPPEGLRVGDVIDVQGQPWALVRIGSGFAASAYQFRPHREQVRPPQGRPIPPRKSKPINRALVEETLDAIRAALEVPTFMDSPPDELRHSFQLIENGWVLANQLLRHLKRISHDEPDSEQKTRLQQQIEAVEYAQKQVSYQRRDAKHFCRHYLGERS